MNLATRTQVLSGNAPSSGFGVPGTLTQPSVALFAGPQRLATNTRWKTAAEAAELRDAARRAGAFAEGSADSALLATLPPGD